MSEGILLQYTGVQLNREENIILRDVDLKVNRGDFLYIIGKVGSGKSTLLKSMYAEIPIEKGDARVFDYRLQDLKRKEIPYLRRKIGIVFQDFQLLIDRTVEKNLEFVLRATGWKEKGAISNRINEVLVQVGMQNKTYKMPHELSGGEQQRIVIARALLNSPLLILADEPTGNLDPETGSQIVDLLQQISATGTAVIMSTHNYSIVQTFPGRIMKCEEMGLVDLNHPA
ncbi:MULTISPECIES: cell division ATP-binding protein FtsE [Petrimonas]|nr:MULTISPECIES: ATP-binding cassette domain-containing protein [Petrimonas]MDD3560090.1 ATP-binding cassette domain-containing protein [Petrimonas mucosa]SFU55472.1 cell division transport system ATP-binding protein [Porphyromonadaceae bacterium KHP3R9]HHT30765.1 ATP-binding cassette domain-containing protein [Petrimonas mucosa]